MKEKDNGTRGAMTIVEATFVFPITFFIVFIMIMAGEMYYEQARVEHLITSWAISGAARCENPMMKSIEGGALPTSPTKPDVMPYRYILSGEAKRIGGSVENDLQKTISGLEPLFFKMTPQDVFVQAKPQMNPFISSLPVKCTYEIEFPIRMIFAKKPMRFEYTIGMTASIGDPAEFVRNIAMLADVLERNETISSFAAKVKKGMVSIGAVTG